MAKGSFTVKGLDNYLEAFAQAGQDVNDVVADLLTEAQPIAEQELHDNLRKTSEQWTGATAETIFTTPPQREGNYVFIELGADTGKDPAGFYKEYGTARQAAEPFIRPAFTKLRRNQLKKMLKRAAETFGLTA
jgi:HK97 gp10 family phage protein